MRVAIEVEDTRTGATGRASFGQSPVRVGRNPLNDLLLDEDFVSQWHGALHFDEREMLFIDFGSTNGTEANGIPVPHRQPVFFGDVATLAIGPLRLTARLGADAEGAVGRLAMGDDPLVTRAGQWTSQEEIEPEDSPVPTTVGGLDIPATNVHTRKASPAIEQLRQMVAAVEAVRPFREAYHEALREQLSSLPAEVRRAMIPQIVARHFPELKHDRDFLAFAEQMGADPSVLREPTVSEWLDRLTGRYSDAPAESRPSDAEAMARIAAVLQTFAQGLLELRNGHRRFLQEAGLGALGESDAMVSATSAEEILGLLFDFEGEADEPMHELTRTFAALATHQVALLHGILEGGRAILDSLSPAAVADGAKQVAGLVPWGARRLHRAFLQRHRDLVDGDHFARTLFGARFARAYQTVAGGRPVASPQPVGTA